MLDIFEDSCGSLEIDRIKDKIRNIWNEVIVAEYNSEYSNHNEKDKGFISLEDYIKENQLYFPGEAQPENEIDSIMEMLEDMFDDKEELDPITDEGKAPTYNGSELKSNNEKGKVEATSYEVKYASTKTPEDSKSSVKSSTYDAPTNGTIAVRKDSQVKRSYAPMVKKIMEDLVDLDKRQAIGKRRQLFRL